MNTQVNDSTTPTPETSEPAQVRRSTPIDAIMVYRAARVLAAERRIHAETAFAKAFLTSEQKNEEAKKQHARVVTADARLGAELAEAESKAAELLAYWMAGVTRS